MRMVSNIRGWCPHSFNVSWTFQPSRCSAPGSAMGKAKAGEYLRATDRARAGALRRQNVRWGRAIALMPAYAGSRPAFMTVELTMLGLAPLSVTVSVPFWF
jgi:hypothetical protein